MGAITATILFRSVFGNKKIVAGTLSPSSSYATNGETYTPSQFGLHEVEFLLIQPYGGFEGEWDKSNLKIIFRAQEPTNGTSGIIAFSEVGSTNNHSSIAFPFIALGY